MRLNLGCSDQLIPNMIGVDRWTPQWATPENFQQADLRHAWPWPDSSVDHIRAHDIIEHLPDAIHTMNEIYRVLKPSGTVEIVVPTTEGRGAWQDPTHVSFWNRNSFFYFTAGDPHYERFHEAYGVKGAFHIKAEQTDKIADGVVKLAIELEAVKEHWLGGSVNRLTDADSMPEKKNRPAFSILHTSARPDKWRESYDAWISAAAHPEQVEYVLCVDERWGFTPDRVDGDLMHSVSGYFRRDRPQDKLIWNTGRRCYVDGVNLAAQASTGDVLIVNADDQWPCEGWDEKIALATMQHNHVQDVKADVEAGIPISGGDGPFIPFDIGRVMPGYEWGEFVVEVSTNTPTEHERGILVMPILSRERYERFGWVFYPAYESMYADNDFCAMARRDGVVIDARHLVFPHRHWINSQREQDEVDLAQNRSEAYREGERIFKARQAINFAGVPPKIHDLRANMPVVAPQGQQQRIVATCTPGESFSGVWKSAWDWLFANLVTRYNVIPLNGYTTDVCVTRMIFAKALIEAQPAPDYALWLDDDNTLTLEQFEMLMGDLDAHPELDAVVGWCWIARHDIHLKEARVAISCGELIDMEYTPEGDVKFCRLKSLDYADLMNGPDDLKSITYSGFPVVLMRADLLKKAGGQDAFLPILDSRYLFGKSGEDYAFFARAAARGAKFAVDRRVEVPHLKLMPAGPPKEMLERHLQQAVKA